MAKTDEVIKLAREKGYVGEDSLVLIQDWIGREFKVRCELFFSMFHKKWSVNNYFINTKKSKKIEWDSKGEMFEDYYDALKLAIENMLKKI